MLAMAQDGMIIWILEEIALNAVDVMGAEKL